MALLPNAAYSLIDIATDFDPTGGLRTVVNMLSQENEILADIPWLQANGGTEHKTSVLTGLPSGVWRQYNLGILPSKTTKRTIKDTCAMLESLSFIDRDLYRLNGESDAWRLQEEKAFIDGLSQQMAAAIFYNNQFTNPATFTGLSPRFSTRDATVANNAVNVLDGGGRGSTNASMWFCSWGPAVGAGIYPKGSVAGLEVRDVTTPAPVDDGTGTGAKFFAVQTHFKWDCGLTISDWRYFVRVANIDVTLLSGPTAANLISLMIAAVNKLPASAASAVKGATLAAGEPITTQRTCIYVNRTLRTALELQIGNRSNAALQYGEWMGQPVLMFRGIPIRNCDALLNTEATV